MTYNDISVPQEACGKNAKLGTSTFEDSLGDSDWHVDATPLQHFFFIDLLRHCPHFKMQGHCARAWYVVSCLLTWTYLLPAATAL
jgi:hypothetical protein